VGGGLLACAHAPVAGASTPSDTPNPNSSLRLLPHPLVTLAQLELLNPAKVYQ
jgi:hypothetical protein